MNDEQKQVSLRFVNLWQVSDADRTNKIASLWKNHASLDDHEISTRLRQLVFVAETEKGEVTAISTAFKTYIQQLGHYLYAFRCMVVPGLNIPGLDAKIVLETRDFLESIHENDLPNKPIGMITLVENPELKKRNHAVWPASGMVYIGTSKEGHHIRVYYFKGARI
jgi:hypothetical protein